MSRTKFEVGIDGRLTQDPVVKKTRAGGDYTSLRIACNERFQNEDGEWEDAGKAYYTVNCFGRQAQKASTLVKGMAVVVLGTLSFDQVETEDGQRQAYSITAQVLGLRDWGDKDQADSYDVSEQETEEE